MKAHETCAPVLFIGKRTLPVHAAFAISRSIVQEVVSGERILQTDSL
jgi:hypothetical protein